MKHILFATDFSETSSQALDYLLAFVQERELRIDLVHVFDIPISMSSSQFPRAVEGLITERGDAVRDDMLQLRDRIPDSQRGEIHVIYGVFPSNEIVELADRLSVDLLVMGMREKYSLFDRVIGTVTAQTISKSSIPVLVIPHGAEFKRIRKIIFPTIMGVDDAFSEQEEEALFKLFDFARFSGDTEVDFLHIQTSGKDMKGQIDAIFEDVPFKGFQYTRSYAERVDQGLLKYLEEGSADMLAFYKPQRSFWERLYRSSLTRKLLFNSSIPILVFT